LRKSIVNAEGSEDAVQKQDRKPDYDRAAGGDANRLERADLQLLVFDVKAVPPVVVERHRRLDLAPADIAGEFLRGLDGFKPLAVLEDTGKATAGRREKATGTKGV